MADKNGLNQSKQAYLTDLGERAKQAKYALQNLSKEEKKQALICVAAALCENWQEIAAANEKDLEKGRKSGMHPGLMDRLRLDEGRIRDMAEGLLQVAELPDPIGEKLETFTHPNGLSISKVRVPLGVVGIIYESRPNVTADAFGLCFKAGNAVILKGGSDAIHSNIAVSDCIRKALSSCHIVEDACQLIADTDRAVTAAFMQMNDYVDVLIPRGSAGLIKMAVENATVPIIETGTGNCHVYIDESADLTKAVNIVVNAKTQRIGVCNSCESLLVHAKVLTDFLPALQEGLSKVHEVSLRGDEAACSVLKNCTPATEADYGKEYLDYILSIKTVSGVEEAIRHINHYGTHHSDAILTENKEHAEKFLKEVDSACVYVNASTRFTDGFEFGFGAEIGISTQRLHARGPMGLKELTTYKYTIEGNGQIR